MLAIELYYNNLIIYRYSTTVDCNFSLNSTVSGWPAQRGGVAVVGARAHLFSDGVYNMKYGVRNGSCILAPSSVVGMMRDTTIHIYIYRFTSLYTKGRRRARWPTGTPSIFCLVGAQKGPAAVAGRTDQRRRRRRQ